jgi:hypothetical protein
VDTVDINDFNRDYPDEIAQALWTAIATNENDHLAKGVLADRLDEIGPSSTSPSANWLAVALRWCMKHHKHPLVNQTWGKLRRKQTDKSHLLPPLIYDRISGNCHGRNVNKNLYIAMLGLAHAFRFIHETID